MMSFEGTEDHNISEQCRSQENREAKRHNEIVSFQTRKPSYISTGAYKPRDKKREFDSLKRQDFVLSEMKYRARTRSKLMRVKVRKDTPDSWLEMNTNEIPATQVSCERLYKPATL